ncbi:MAG: folate hydrolase, partial [Ginsengibacter sp.]
MIRTTITFFLVLIMNYGYSQAGITGFSSDKAAVQHTLEGKFDDNLSKENIGATIKKLAAKPHAVGSPAGKENALYIESLMKKWGWDAEIETFEVLFPT